MGIQIEQQLGSLEINALLGKGGMGEIYRARDMKLKRDVAIKMLPDEFLRDADRVRRFGTLSAAARASIRSGGWESRHKAHTIA